MRKNLIKYSLIMPRHTLCCTITDILLDENNEDYLQPRNVCFVNSLVDVALSLNTHSLFHIVLPKTIVLLEFPF